MPERRHKAIGSTGRGLVYALGSIEANPELDKAQALDTVHDGDTIKVNPDGYLPVRCLAIDTPEVSFQLPGRGFLKIDSEPWQEYLADPFSVEYEPFEPELEPGLRANIEPQLVPRPR